jgi:hypothetical protein
MTRDPIVPEPWMITAWRIQAETARELGGVKLGEFDWPWVVLSLIQGWEKNNAAE